MELKINLLTGKVNEESNNKINVSEVDFWKYYLQLLNTTKPIFTDREIDFTAHYIVNTDPKYLQDQLKMSAPNYYGMIKKLQAKGIITKDSINPSLEKIVDYARKHKFDITITFPFKIDYYVNT